MLRRQDACGEAATLDELAVRVGLLVDADQQQQGSRETEAMALAVIPWSQPSAAVVTTVAPVANCPTVWR